MSRPEDGRAVEESDFAGGSTTAVAVALDDDAERDRSSEGRELGLCCENGCA